MEKALTLNNALKKGKSKICCVNSCSQVSRNLCEKCSQPACKFHMCARTKNKKKIKICDKCNYSEIKEQIELENQKEKKQALEKLQSINEKNSESREECKIDESKLQDLEERLMQIESENSLKNERKLEEIQKEQYLKDRNIEMLANLKAAIDNSGKIYTAENEKLVQVKSQASSLQIDVNQVHSKIKELGNSIKSLKDLQFNSVTEEKLLDILCQKCISRYRGISVLRSVNVYKEREKKESGEACSKCLII